MPLVSRIRNLHATAMVLQYHRQKAASNVTVPRTQLTGRRVGGKPMSDLPETGAKTGMQRIGALGRRVVEFFRSRRARRIGEWVLGVILALGIVTYIVVPMVL